MFNRCEYERYIILNKWIMRELVTKIFFNRKHRRDIQSFRRLEIIL